MPGVVFQGKCSSQKGNVESGDTEGSDYVDGSVVGNVDGHGVSGEPNKDNDNYLNGPELFHGLNKGNGPEISVKRLGHDLQVSSGFIKSREDGLDCKSDPFKKAGVLHVSCPADLGVRDSINPAQNCSPIGAKKGECVGERRRSWPSRSCCRGLHEITSGDEVLGL